MKRILLLAAAIVFPALIASGAWAFSERDVAQMHKDGVADSLVIQKIQHSGKRFSLDANGVRELKKAGVSDEVISAMLATEDQGRPASDNGSYYPHVTVGLGFWGNYGYLGYYGHYGPYYGPYYGYYGSYYRPYYAPYYGHYGPYYRGFYAPRRYGYYRPLRAPYGHGYGAYGHHH